MYKLLKEDNTLVMDYPTPEIYKNMSEEEKENIKLFKKEIEKITLEKGLGRVSVNVSYDGPSLEKEFIIKHVNGFTRDYYEEQIDIINDSLEEFSKKNNLYDFYLDIYVLLE